MRSYDEILQIAEDRKGSREAVLKDMPKILSSDDLAGIPGNLWLSCMARGIFQAGISWRVVENKWPGIEEAFFGFDLGRCAFMDEDWFEALLNDRRIIRAAPKIRAIQQNAVFIQEVSAEHGSFGQRVGDWPVSDFAGLLAWLKTSGSRLGGVTGAYMLRVMGKEGYILSASVLARLIEEAVIDKAPTSARAMRAVQEAFNIWQAQSNESLTTISRVLAQSIDP